MLPTKQGSIKLFRFAGIDVYVHWMWLVAVFLRVHYSKHEYSSVLWNIFECLAAFLIVLTHEFGHSLACRSVGGKADKIFLWLLGGVAYVDPPQRPGAVLWSIAAGPLVNVVLIPILTILMFLANGWGWSTSLPDAYHLICNVWLINNALLIFNIMPVYPLDGGQIVRALLWFWLGRARSLRVAALIGLPGVIGFAVLVFVISSGAPQSLSISLIMLYFLGTRCWQGWREARVLALLEKLPRHDGFACPSCHMAPPRGAFWQCGNCRSPYDVFNTHATCPHCGSQFGVAFCPDCHALSPIQEWIVPGSVPPVIR